MFKILKKSNQSHDFFPATFPEKGSPLTLWDSLLKIFVTPIFIQLINSMTSHLCFYNFKMKNESQRMCKYKKNTHI